MRKRIFKMGNRGEGKKGVVGGIAIIAILLAFFGKGFGLGPGNGAGDGEGNGGDQQVVATLEGTEADDNKSDQLETEASTEPETEETKETVDEKETEEEKETEGSTGNDKGSLIEITVKEGKYLLEGKEISLNEIEEMLKKKENNTYVIEDDYGSAKAWEELKTAFSKYETAYTQK